MYIERKFDSEDDERSAKAVGDAGKIVPQISPRESLAETLVQSRSLNWTNEPFLFFKNILYLNLKNMINN